jgi:hypothetical protein
LSQIGSLVQRNKLLRIEFMVHGFDNHGNEDWLELVRERRERRNRRSSSSLENQERARQAQEDYDRWFDSQAAEYVERVESGCEEADPIWLEMCREALAKPAQNQDQQGYVLWLRTGSHDWMESGSFSSRDEAADAMQIEGWSSKSFPVAYRVLPIGQRPGPDTIPDVEFDFGDDEDQG